MKTAVTALALPERRDEPPRSATHAAVMALFFTSGAVFALWGVHIPSIKARFGLDDAEVARLLFAISAGAILAMGPMGGVIDRFGSARVCRWAVTALALVFGGLMWLPSVWWLAPALAAFGATQSALDVAMNAQAVDLENLRGRPIMSRLHGLFSAGGLVGAALGSAALAAGWPAARTCGVAAAMALVGLAIGSGHLLSCGVGPAADAVPSDSEASQNRRALWSLGLLALLGLVTEGAMYDWSSVYLHDVLASPAGRIGSGYACFSGGMTAARFGGDALRARLGGVRLLQGSGALCIVGVALLCIRPSMQAALAGFSLLGLGCANLVPVLFAAASQVGPSAAAAIASVGRLAYAGLLLGPVIIGSVSAHTGLQRALWLLAVGSGTIAVAAGPALRRRVVAPTISPAT